MVVHSLFFQDIQIGQNESIHKLVYRWIFEAILLQVYFTILISKVFSTCSAGLGSIALLIEAIGILVLEPIGLLIIK